ncbi:MAG TPA: ADOP family duplicated permease [Vicinamibacterales bacterium]|nr:ADOP family duplicated permease [Vicinamibacterales bacterium]
MLRILQDLRFALRTFAKAPGFTGVSVLVLALGIGANSAIFSIVNVMLFQPLSGRAGDLVGVFSHDRTHPDSYRAFSYPNYVDIRERSGLFDGLMAHIFAMVGVPAGDTMKRSFAELVSSNYFDTLGVRLAAGRPFTREEEQPGAHVPVVIVSYAKWKTAGLDPAFLGSTIRINAEDFTVVGVAPHGFTGTMALLAPDLYLPLGMFDTVVNDIFKNKGTGLADRSNHALILAGRVKPGLSDAVVAGRLDALSRQLEGAFPAENKDQALTVSPLARMSTSTSPQTDGGLGALTALLMALSAVVLLIACLNLANMLLARGTARRKEVALRLALGAKRSRIVRQLLTESLLLALTGAALGLVLSYWATRTLTVSLAALLPLAVSFDSRPDAAVLGATIAFAALSTVVFGLGPAVKLSRRDLVSDLKDLGAGGSPTGRRFGARNLMVIGQVALSLALLVAGGIFARAAVSAAAGNPGYPYERLLLATLDPSLAGIDDTHARPLYRSVLERVRRLPGVEAAGMTSTVPFGDMHEGTNLERVGTTTSEEAGRTRTYRIISADYFASLGLKMVRGREFTRAEEESASAPAVAIIDQALARRLFGDEDPIGQLIRIKRRPEAWSQGDLSPMQIVGIAPPIRDELLDRAPVTHVYVPFGRNYRANMHLHVRLAAAGNAAGALDALRREIRAADARLPVLALSTMQGFHDRGLELWALKAGGRLFTALGLLALLLAVVGVYGVKSYVVSQRTREFGIRMALGANARDVLGLVLRDGFFLTGMGLAAGLPLAALVSVAFTKVFVEIGGFDPLVTGLASGALALAATAASAIPARRATRVAPLSALRHE